MNLDEALMANPHLKVGELTEEQLKIFTDSLNFIYDAQTSHIEQSEKVVHILLEMEDVARNEGEITYWTPFEEGYDEGPGCVADTWRKHEPVTTGQFRGHVLDEDYVCHISGNMPGVDNNGFISAACLEAYIFSEGDDPDPEKFVKRMKEWEGPRPLEERDASIEAHVIRLVSQFPPERRIEFLIEIVIKMGGDPADPKFFENTREKAFAAIKPKLESDVTAVIGKGDRDYLDWVLVETPKGRLSIKQAWATKGDPRSVDIFVMSNFYISQDDGHKYSADYGCLAELDVPKVPEQIGHQYVDNY